MSYLKSIIVIALSRRGQFLLKRLKELIKYSKEQSELFGSEYFSTLEWSVLLVRMKALQLRLKLIHKIIN